MLLLPTALVVTPQWLFAGQGPKHPGGTVSGRAEVHAAVMAALSEIDRAVNQARERYAMPADPVTEKTQAAVAEEERLTGRGKRGAAGRGKRAG